MNKFLGQYATKILFRALDFDFPREDASYRMMQLQQSKAACRSTEKITFYRNNILFRYICELLKEPEEVDLLPLQDILKAGSSEHYISLRGLFPHIFANLREIEIFTYQPTIGPVVE